MHWLGNQTVMMLMLALIFALIAGMMNMLVDSRVSAGLMTKADEMMVTDSFNYCFCVEAISLLSLTLVDIAFRRPINNFQYILIGCAICLFNLLLAAFTEKMPFWVSYPVVAVMTIGLIAPFVKGITGIKKAAGVTASILTVEYGLIFLLLYLDSMALLVGSLALFVVLAAAMYFTLKLKVEDGILFLKR